MRTLRSAEKRYQVWDSHRGFCALCGKHIECDEPFDIDHIVPYSKGGKTVLSNLQLSCPSCNRIKGDKTDVYKSKIPKSNPC